MKLNQLTTAILLLMVIAIYGQSKPPKSDVLYSKILMLKSGLTKQEMKKIMGEPYKISFTTSDKQEFIEDLYYKTSIRIDKWTIITY